MRDLSPSEGHFSDDSSATSDSESDGCMRVGMDYQATVPEYNPSAKHEVRNEDMIVWAPCAEALEVKVDEYLSTAKEKYSYNTEQALGMLFWHRHDVDKALGDLPNFTPFPDEWSVEDKVLFEQAFGFHGKHFFRIRQMLPDKSISQLVKFYYSWKKTRSRTSLMDKQARRLNNIHGDSGEEADDSDASDAEAESDTKIAEKEKEKPEPPPVQKPITKKVTGMVHLKGQRKLPRGMCMKNEDLLAMAQGPPGQSEALLKQLDTELVQLRHQCQSNKQALANLRDQCTMTIDGFRPTEASQKINSRWTNEELMLAVQGMRRYGKDFKAIAETIGNKTEGHLRNFFVNYRRRYNLDDVLAEYEKEHGVTNGNGTVEEAMDVGGSGDAKAKIDSPLAPVHSSPGKLNGGATTIIDVEMTAVS